MKKLIWKIDMLLYRLFYWRWAPRLKADPNLAYMFKEFSVAWSAANPPTNLGAVNDLLRAERDRIQKQQPCLDRSHWH